MDILRRKGLPFFFFFCFFFPALNDNTFDPIVLDPAGLREICLVKAEAEEARREDSV